MRAQQRRRPTRPKAPLVVAAILVFGSLVCVIFVYALNLLNILSTFYTVVSIPFIVATFVLTYYAWITSQNIGSLPAGTAEEVRPPRRILGAVPFTEPPIIQQRDALVRDIYDKMLNLTGSTALVLIGIVGSGKSHVAALVSKYAEKQPSSGNAVFTDKPLWLHIDEVTTFIDIAVTICEGLGKTVLDFNNMSPSHQGQALFDVLMDQKRLIVLDQFDKLLDVQTGRVYTDRQGVGEWLDALLSQPSTCRILITSRCWPQGPRRYPYTDENHHNVEGLDEPEAIQLLLSQGGSEITKSKQSEFDRVLNCCNNHPWALVLLAYVLRLHRLSLANFFNEPVHVRSWRKGLAHDDCDQDLDNIYYDVLNPIQRDLLRAFAIFRTPVPMDAAQAVINFTAPKIGVQFLWQKLKKVTRHTTPMSRIAPNCEVLLRNHLLQAFPDRQYQLHPIIAAYALDRFAESSEDDPKQVLQDAHAEAAQYYLQRIQDLQGAGDQQFDDNLRQSYIVETIWHQCRAKQWRKAYKLMERENIFTSLRNRNENTTLFDLYQEMLPLEKWRQESSTQRVAIYSNLSEVCKALGKNEEALNYYGKALAICTDNGDPDRAVIILLSMGDLHEMLGRPEQAQTCRDEADRLRN
jgi:tetratricopeptide (TPR) repeat protein